MADLAVALAVIGTLGWSIVTAAVTGLPYVTLLPSFWAVPMFFGVGVVATFVISRDFLILWVTALGYGIIAALIVFVLDLSAVTASEWAYIVGLVALLGIAIYATCVRDPEMRGPGPLPVFTTVSVVLAIIVLVYNMFVADALHALIDGRCWTCYQLTEVFYHQSLTFIVTVLLAAVHARETQWATTLLKTIAALYALFLLAFAITKASIAAPADVVWATVITAIVGVATTVWGAVAIEPRGEYENAGNGNEEMLPTQLSGRGRLTI